MKFRKSLAMAVVLVVSLMALVGCGGQAEKSQEAESKNSPQTADNQEVTQAGLQLTDHELFVYCGAGMKKPFQDIADGFEKETGCKMTVNFANAAQIQTQINTAKEGDLFIAGSEVELKPIKDLVTDQLPLVKHIPVLAVQKDNPKAIQGLQDLTKEGIRLVLGDVESTPIGKIADKALKDAKILDKVDIVSRALTAPPMATALANDECDAVIIWKENVNTELLDIVDTADLNTYVKKVPAASLSTSKDSEARDAFLNYLKSEKATAIWEKYGYEIFASK